MNDAVAHAVELTGAAGTIAVRACTPDDADALALIGAATFLETFAGVLDGRDVARYCAKGHAPAIYADWIADHRARVWIATAAPGDAPVGYAVVAPSRLPLDDADEGDLEVKRIYLLPRFQGLGLGRKLIDVAIAFARQVGAPRLLLGVYAANEGAKAFYARIGFAAAGTRRFRVGDRDYDDVIMALPLGDVG